VTSVTRNRPAVRLAAVAAGVTGVLTLTACGGGGGGDDSSATPSTKPSSTADHSGGGGTGGSGGTTSEASGLQGSWLATTGGKAVALVVTGTRAGLFATGGTVCSGTAGEESGMRMIHLTCPDGDKKRATGMVDSMSTGTLVVTWSGSLGKETYTKAEGASLPTGLPTASLGS
jgi:hypothetical protein